MVVQAHREDEAEVEVLIANLDKRRVLTKKIQGSLSRLDIGGQVVHDAIGPINNTTQQLQVTRRNIDGVNEAIERLRRPLDAKGREEGVIRAGPKSAGLKQYLGALNRVDHALSDLTSSNLRSNQQAISEFNLLLTSGSGQLQDLFQNTLRQSASPVEPLHYITKSLQFPVLDDETVAELRPIATAISSAAAKTRSRRENPAVRIYAEVRGPYISLSLQNLATASISTSVKKQDAGIYRAGTSGIGAYASGLEGMISAEATNTSLVFTTREAEQAVELTCQPAMNEFTKTLKELNAFIKNRILTDCFLAFEIIDLVTPVSYHLEKETGGRLKPQFSDALRPIREIARSSLSELYEQTRLKASSTTVLPNDGNTVPIASETMQRLATLAVYSTPLKAILSSIGDGGWRSGPASDLKDSSGILANYVSDFIETLFSCLEGRARAFHRSKSLQGCFLSNTYAIVDRALRTSPDLGNILSSSPSHLACVEAWRKKASSLYLDAWREPSSHLLDVQYTSRSSNPSGNRPVSGSAVDSVAIVKALSSKDKDKIKEKFKAFNSSFDEMIARHKALYMEREVKATLGREVQALIEPLYARFWDRYHELDKGKGKTVKYSKADLASVLVGLS